MKKHVYTRGFEQYKNENTMAHSLRPPVEKDLATGIVFWYSQASLKSTIIVIP
jgi:hypothetical protein